MSKTKSAYSLCENSLCVKTALGMSILSIGLELVSKTWQMDFYIDVQELYIFEGKNKKKKETNGAFYSTSLKTDNKLSSPCKKNGENQN